MESLSAFKAETEEQKDHGFMQKIRDYVRKSSVGKYALGLMAAASLYASDMVKPDDAGATYISLEKYTEVYPGMYETFWTLDITEDEKFVYILFNDADMPLLWYVDSDDYRIASENKNGYWRVRDRCPPCNTRKFENILSVWISNESGLGPKELFPDIWGEHKAVLLDLDTWTDRNGYIEVIDNVSPVPEPGTLFLLGFGIAGVGLGILRQRKEG